MSKTIRMTKKRKRHLKIIEIIMERIEEAEEKVQYCKENLSKAEGSLKALRDVTNIIKEETHNET